MTTKRVPRPPVPLQISNTLKVPAGTIWHRTHLSSLRAAQFNPCLGLPSRFAPFSDMSGNCVPSLYGAASLEAAAFEMIFHDIKAKSAFKTVPLSVPMARSVSQIACARELKLAKLFAPDLKLWKIQRSDIIETSKATYRQTVRWAQAIYQADASLDGLVWTSRQCDPDVCILLFGDRVAEGEFSIVSSSEVRSDPAILVKLRSFAARAGITITV